MVGGFLLVGLFLKVGLNDGILLGFRVLLGVSICGFPFRLYVFFNILMITLQLYLLRTLKLNSPLYKISKGRYKTKMLIYPIPIIIIQGLNLSSRRINPTEYIFDRIIMLLEMSASYECPAQVR